LNDKCIMDSNKSIDEKILVISGKRLVIRLSSLGIAIYTGFIITQPWLALFEEIRAALHIVIVLMALLILVAGNYNNYKIKLETSKIDLFWGLAYALIVLYIFMNGIAAYSFDLFFYTAGIFFLLLTKTSIENYRVSIKLLSLAAVIYAAGSIVQFLFTDSFNKFLFIFASTSAQLRITELVSGNYFPGFGFGAPATAAAFMVVGLGLALALWKYSYKQRKILNKLLIGSFTFILFFGLLATGKRSILMWAVAALFITYYVMGSGKKNKQRIITIILLIAFFILLFFILPIVLDDSPLYTRFASLVMDLKIGEASGSVALRFRHYQDAWKLFLENPLFGVGWRQFVVLTTGFYPRGYSVHNVYLQLLCEMGIFGFSIIMLPFVYAYYQAYKAFRAVLKQPLLFAPLWKIGLAYSFYFQTFFLFYSLTENPFYNIIYMLLYFLAVSISNAYIVIEKVCSRT
jgi:O-antigen ligase